MLLRDKILRNARILSWLGILLAAGAACSNRTGSATAPATESAPAPAPVPDSAAPAPAPPPAPALAPAGPASATSVMVPYDEFADMQYYLLKGTNTVVVEFFDGSGTSIVDIQCELQKSGPAPVLHVRILGNKTGPETKKFEWDTEGNAVYYFDVGDADKSKLRVVYDDDKGGHDMPAAGIVDRRFDVEKPPTPQGAPAKP